MPTGSHRKDAGRRAATDGILCALALILSYLETFVSPAVMPVPGFKIGLANIAVMAAVYFSGDLDALAVTLVRVGAAALLFGNAASFAFSLTGALLSLTMLIILKYTAKNHLGWCGVSVLSAAAHNAGQLIAAAVILGNRAVIYYLPVLLAASALYGTVNGIVMNLAVPKLHSLKKEN